MMFKTIAAALAVAALFLFLAGPGLKAWFTDDQLMNLFQASDRPVAELALQPDRPVATLAMRGLWELFGIHPRPYRVVCFALLLLNFALATALAWRLSQSGVTTLFFAVLFSYHACLTDLYFSTATLYDILCFTFTFAALLWHATLRIQSRAPNWRELAGICLLSALAIGSKEMAVALPLLHALIEWLYGDRRHWLTPIFSAAICAAFVARFLIHSGFQANASYRTTYTLETFWANWQHYQSMLFYQFRNWSPLATKITLAVCLLLPALLRRRESWFASAVALITPLPILFIEPRNLYAFYIPYFGFCLLAAAVLTKIAIRRWPPIDLAVVLALFLIPHHLAAREWANAWYYAQERMLSEPGKAVSKSLPPLRPSSRILFVDDPFPLGPTQAHTLYYLVSLAANDHTFHVYRAKAMSPPPTESEWPSYAAVFRLTQNEMVRLR
ncbi:MAG TPA: hypothetical protein VGK29_01980 [Paludibaculum sp.]|jgi:hypothetical protein